MVKTDCGGAGEEHTQPQLAFDGTKALMGDTPPQRGGNLEGKPDHLKRAPELVSSGRLVKGL